MIIVKIEAESNKAHRNQDWIGIPPTGWAILPCDTAELQNFPFGTFDTKDVDGILYVIQDSWIPLPLPAPAPAPEHEPPTDERIAILEQENKLLTQQVDALSSQNDFQEELIVELAKIVYA